MCKSIIWIMVCQCIIARMDLHLRAFWRAATEWKRFQVPNVFLTGYSSGTYSSKCVYSGATGFLGSHLLAELLNSTKSKIVCLVRESASGAESVNQRLLATLRKNGILSESLEEQLRFLLLNDLLNSLFHFQVTEFVL